MEVHQANAIKLAQFLEGHKNVKKVYYGDDYRVRDSLALLEKVGIEIERLQDVLTNDRHFEQEGFRALFR